MKTRMDHYQNMLKICMIGLPIFTILTALCAFGWNYYGLKIKEIDSKQKTKSDTIQSVSIKNVYHVNGNLITQKDSSIDTAKFISSLSNEANTFSEVILDIGNTNLGPNPYFTYEKNLMDFVVTVYAVGNTVGRIKSKTLTLVRCDSEGAPFDSKSFYATDINESDLIYNGKPFTFSQRMGNLTEPLFDSLFVVIDIVYSNEKKTLEKMIRKIYSVKPEYAKKKVPPASQTQYLTIDKYLESKVVA